MTYVFKSIVVTVATVDQAREQAAKCEGGQDMFQAALSPTGSAPITNYISSGYITYCILDNLKSIPNIVISDLPPFDLIESLNLKLVDDDSAI